MEILSEIPHGGGSPWKGLLITAAFLSTWIQSESTQSPEMKVEPSPPYGTVGGNITLSILGVSKEPGSYTWFRKTITESNRIVTYNVQTRQQTPASGRETVFPNGSLVITNLTLDDSGEYIVEMFYINGDWKNYQLSHLKVHFQVYDSNSRRRVITGIVIGVLTGVTLIGAFIYFLFIRKTGGASQGILGDPGLDKRTHPTQKHCQIRENIYWLQDSTPSTQVLGSTPTSSAATPETIYQALDITKVDIYDSLEGIRKPQTKEGGRSP
ncbi:cell adhesion molecule CEACAM21-like isoform X2 [Macrotis lagotis]|uniref:cell adhesion molecule CEACAM21-like isoform X2 n=1 Tax=Macrotis lagotis TaxID=92651 RepID=UPI003D683E38